MDKTPHETTQAHFEGADNPPFDGPSSDNGPGAAPSQRLRPTAASEKPRVEECDFDGTNPPPEEDDPAVTDQPIEF